MRVGEVSIIKCFYAGTAIWPGTQTGLTQSASRPSSVTRTLSQPRWSLHCRLCRALPRLPHCPAFTTLTAVNCPELTTDPTRAISFASPSHHPSVINISPPGPRPQRQRQQKWTPQSKTRQRRSAAAYTSTARSAVAPNPNVRRLRLRVRPSAEGRGARYPVTHTTETSVDINKVTDHGRAANASRRVSTSNCRGMPPRIRRRCCVLRFRCCPFKL